MEIIFRQALFTDINSIINVQNRSFYDDYIKYGECPAYNESPEAIGKLIRDAKVYVIEYDSQMVGDIIVHKKSQDTYYLRVLCVVPEFHNLGIGQKAIQFVEKDNVDAKIWELITPFKSFRNHYFYEKMGYVKVSEYKHSDILTMFEYRKEIN